MKVLFTAFWVVVLVLLAALIVGFFALKKAVRTIEDKHKPVNNHFCNVNTCKIDIDKDDTVTDEFKVKYVTVPEGYKIGTVNQRKVKIIKDDNRRNQKRNRRIVG